MRWRTYFNFIFMLLLQTVLTVAEQPPDFAKQIVPILTKAGCNSGACHGAAAGRGYLQLSLFGGRPAADYEALTHAPGQRYIDSHQALQSLVLQKPSGFLEHGGGVRLDSEGADFRRFIAWIEAGAPRGGLAKLQRIEILPLDLNLSGEVLVSIGESFPIGARACWSDGSVTDVSEWLSIEGASETAKPDAVVSMKSEGGRVRLTAHRAGVWPITLRVASVAKAIQVWCRTESTASTLLGQQLPTQAFVQLHSIDSVIAKANQKLGLILGPPTAAHLLVRRLWLDLLGRHPRLEEWQNATMQIEQGQKERLVDQLLASPDFNGHAAQKITSWVAKASKGSGDTSILQNAIAERIAQDDDLRGLVRSMLEVLDAPVSKSEGEVLTVASEGLAAFHRFANDPRSRAELVAATWMGVRVGCAQCHDHPLDHWTQDDYFALAACWAEIDSQKSIMRIPGRTTSDLRNGEPAVPRLPDGKSLQPVTSDDLLGGQTAAEPLDTAFARWLTAPDNHYLANNLANRLWQWCFGRGLIVDEDDHRETNPPAVRELLSLLAQHLRANNFRLRPLLREIVLSDAYARSSSIATVDSAVERELQVKLLSVRVPKDIDFPHFEDLAKQALQMAQPDVSQNPAQAGAGAETMTMLPASTSADCMRYQVCQDTFSQHLDIVSGATLQRLIATSVEQLLENKSVETAPETLIALMYRRLYGQQPNAIQVESWQRLITLSESSKASQQELLSDILWSLLVSDAFRRLH